MKVRLVSYESPPSWIVGSLATRLEVELRSLGVEVTLGVRPDVSADVNHHIIYAGYNEFPSSIDTLMITHIDTAAKVTQLQRQLATATMGICLSSDTMNKLVALGLPRARLCFINYPSPQNGQIERRRTHVGITSRTYRHGSKREYMLGELAHCLRPGEFVFHFMGLGWDVVIDELRRCGTEVVFHGDFAQDEYRRLWQMLDYYLYVGQDEGSTGLLDALEAGVPTIATPQGFHLDVAGGLTHVVDDMEDLRRIFCQISEARSRLRAAVARLTWPEYARMHLALWGELINRRAGKVEQAVDQACLAAMRVSPQATPASPPPRGLAAMPHEAGPGGAVHRPRLLVVADEPLGQVEAGWQQIIASTGGQADIVVRCEGEQLDQQAYLGGVRLEVKLVDWRSRSIEDLAILSLDFDAVGFWNMAPVQAVERLEHRWKPNYLMRFDFLSRLSGAIGERSEIATLARQGLFRFVRALGTTSRAKMISFWTRPFDQAVPSALRIHDLRVWLESMDAVIYAASESDKTIEAYARHAWRVPVQGTSCGQDGWKRAVTIVLDVIETPRGAEKPGWLHRTLLAKQSAKAWARSARSLISRWKRR
jgi:hypothetical protein